MPTTLFDVRIRSVECTRCGAPLESTLSGGQALCRYCGTTSVVSVRRGSRRALTLSPAEDIARLSRLKGQLANPIEGHAYDLKKLPSGWSEFALEHPRAQDRLRYEWIEAKSGPVSESLEAQRKTLWLALQLADRFRAEGHLPHTRAVLETALDLLPDEGHRHLILCRLVAEAVREGDASSAREWLADCRPDFELVDLDSAYRLAACLVRTSEGDFPAALALAGERHEAIPIHASADCGVSCLRMHALEKLGRAGEAYDEFLAAVVRHPKPAVVGWLVDHDLAPGVLRRDSQAQVDELVRERSGLPIGLRALVLPFWTTAVIAGAFTVATYGIHCSCSADPFYGVHGHLLCPDVCPQCVGPLRVHTDWSCNGGECSTNGPDYFCHTADRKPKKPRDRPAPEDNPSQDPHVAGIVVVAAFLLTYLVLLSPLILLGSIGRHRLAVRSRDTLTQRIEALRAALSER